MRLSDINIKSGDDYADLLIGDLRPLIESDGMDLRLFEIWSDKLRELCNTRYYEYVSGDVETFLLSDKEVMKTYTDSTLEFTGEVLGELVDKGEVSISIREDGEILYGLPKKMVEELDEKKKKNRRRKNEGK